MTDAELAETFDMLVGLLETCEVMRVNAEENSIVGVGGIHAGWVLYFETCADEVRNALFAVAGEGRKRNRALPGQGVIARLASLDASAAQLRRAVVSPPERRTSKDQGKAFTGTDEERQALIAWLGDESGKSGSASSSSSTSAAPATPRPAN